MLLAFPILAAVLIGRAFFIYHHAIASVCIATETAATVRTGTAYFTSFKATAFLIAVNPTSIAATVPMSTA